MTATVIRGDARSLPLPDASVDLIVTSPPYFGLRSYTDGGEHYDGQIGSEATPAEYIAALVECTQEWVRVLKPEGSLFVNLGDKYATTSPVGSGGKGPASRVHGVPDSAAIKANLQSNGRRVTNNVTPKSLLGLPWRYALAATDQLGLILRRDIIWSKPNGLPESVTDRCRSSHEYVFHLVKQPRYFSAVDEIREPHTWTREIDPKWAEAREQTAERRGGGHRNGLSGGFTQPQNPLGKLPGSVWTIPSQPLTVPPALGVDHFAAFPMELPRRIISGWSPAGVCMGCGQGRRPVVQGGRNGDDSKPHKRAMRVSSFDWAAWKEGEPHRITGYACACDRAEVLPPTRPSLVVDPFGGTGTAALVASALGRHGITVDLSADYCRLANWRLQDPSERAKAMQVPKPEPVHQDQASLFEVGA